MSNKTEWQHLDLGVWGYTEGDYNLRVYKASGVWHYDVVKGTQALVTGKPALSLSTAKRMATKWLRQHTQPAPDDEQAQALKLATELERLQAMEKRLKTLYEDTIFWGNKPLSKILERLLRGEDAPNE